MMRSLVVLGCLLLAGCMTNVTTTTLRRTPDGGFVLSSGKDVKMETLTINVAPGNRYVVKITGYSSNANVDVIQAQSAREAAIAAGAIQAIEAGIKIGAKAVVPLP